MSAIPNLSRRYTYQDYLNFPEDMRCELLDGVVCDLPSPTWDHQKVVGRLNRIFEEAFDGHACQPVSAPFDVLFPEADQSASSSPTTLQPDLMVFCDPTKIKERYAVGAPDLIVEVLSPSTALRDQTTKAATYERHGVREYWIVDMDAREIRVLLLNQEGRFDRQPPAAAPETLASHLFPQVRVDLGALFDGIPRTRRL